MIRQIIRLKSEGYSLRKINETLGLAYGTVWNYIQLIKSSNKNLEELLNMSDQDLASAIGLDDKEDPLRFPQLSERFEQMEKDLSYKGMTLMKLWEEYKADHPDGYQYSQFCHYFSSWENRRNAYMPQIHKAGEKLYVDFTGHKLEVTDQETGEVKKVEVYVGILGCSHLTYVEAVWSQKKEDFIGAVQRNLEYYGGVPEAIVPDNLKAAVTKSDKYEAEINATFQEFALHYGTTIVPARAKKPKDKALVENAVKLVYQRIFTALRTRLFHSLEELNGAISEELEKYNNRLFKHKEYSRRQLFEQVEKSELQPLSAEKFEIRTHKIVTVQKYSHVCLYEDHHYYSVPFQYVGKKVHVIYTSKYVEVYHNRERIAYHLRDSRSHKYTTVKEHMPSSHNFKLDWNPEKFTSWAASIGKPTLEIITHILRRKTYPEQAYKSCIGILSYAKKVGNQRLNNACLRAIEYQSYNYQVVKSILEKGLDQTSTKADYDQYSLPYHDNVRGRDFYE
ncbi:MAG: IS21 family transposase [Cytophagaceae bacterium]|nr:IS21 family transposase [Cytophagaceae bacterium]